MSTTETANRPSPASGPDKHSCPDKQTINTESDITAWVDQMLLPPGFFQYLHPGYAWKSPGPILGLNFCCAETSVVGMTKASDDDSHSTISEENNPEPKTTPTEPTTSSVFESLEDFLTNNLCGGARADGLPPTIDVATPVTKMTDETQSENNLASVALDENRAKSEHAADPETSEEEQKIVMYYPESTEETEKKPAEKAPVDNPLVVTVELDPVMTGCDDPIMLERARVENAEASKSPHASLSNVEATSTGAIMPSSVRFQNLATGSFCEVTTGNDDDTPASSEESVLKIADDLPLVEEEEGTETSKEVSLGVEEEKNEDEQTQEVQDDAKAKDESLLDLCLEEDEEEADGVKDNCQEVMEEGMSEEKDMSDAVATDEPPAIPVETSSKPQSNQGTEVTTNATVKMTSLFVGVLDSCEKAN